MSDSVEHLSSVFLRLKKKPPRQLDNVMHDLHDKAFDRIDCLTCANCCKTTGPLWTKKDRERVAKHLKMQTAQFEATYLRIDEDQDWVLQHLPCPFLGGDNRCGIYDVRPKACREYPHSDRVKQHQLLSLHAKNCSICPAIEDIAKGLDASLAVKQAKGNRKGKRKGH
ncbi:MAG: YkgJ family cysteine cluster protein [Schleiferiaceae bacterium]|jgi:hypothetical protein|nr:YkgJ family cysteine cluster protein [Flavobacteriales bacterium]MDG1005897.1 YkgJ family cysteine cluster protein [Schleiferiaceae bacterium]MBT3573171.1 YkgJ family cysteine cluster protein [Flavobacteriales bacterium]MBT3678356.1 YkgJ family cysteine cluster protein [Flavobacteriales bacterium]MBT3740428.1 YkgJ family cysteine cluster protein [Flavobacteriales bacterium]